ncbi:MAG: hypothetical protein QW356_08500, partial [Candidatus Hadarchaeales archaeon]
MKGRKSRRKIWGESCGPVHKSGENTDKYPTFIPLAATSRAGVPYIYISNFAKKIKRCMPEKRDDFS